VADRAPTVRGDGVKVSFREIQKHTCGELSTICITVYSAFQVRSRPLSSSKDSVMSDPIETVGML